MTTTGDRQGSPAGRRRAHAARLDAAVAAAALLGACGQRGPLYLPDSRPAKKLAPTAPGGWRPTAAVSLDHGNVPTGWKRVLVDLVFYGLLAFVVASSVKVAGVLVVFTWLVMPPVCAFLWLSKMKHAIWMSVPIALLGTMGGMLLSFKKDWPIGPAIVVVFGALVALLYILKLFIPERAAESEAF